MSKAAVHPPLITPTTSASPTRNPVGRGAVRLAARFKLVR